MAADEQEQQRRGRARREIGEILNDEERQEKIRQLIDNVMELKGTEWGFCPNCRKKVQVEVADLKGRVDGLIKLLEQAEGKPQDEASAGVTLIVERVWPGAADATYPFNVHPTGTTVGLSPLAGEGEGVWGSDGRGEESGAL